MTSCFHHRWSEQELINTRHYCRVIWPLNEWRLYRSPLKTKARCWWVSAQCEWGKYLLWIHICSQWTDVFSHFHLFKMMTRFLSPSEMLSVRAGHRDSRGERAGDREEKCWWRQIAGEPLLHEWQGELELTHILVSSESHRPRLSSCYKLCIFIVAALQQLSRISGTKEPSEERRKSSAHIAISVLCLHESATGAGFLLPAANKSVHPHN